MEPINPVLPLFYAHCHVCGYHGNSTHMATGDKPFTYVCFAHQDDATREAVRLNTSKQFLRFMHEQPGLVATARRSLGIRRPRRTPYTADWAGCGVD